MKENSYIVYQCKFEDEIVYIGSGAKGRHRHCVSGVSGVYQLNRIYFSNDRHLLSVQILHEGLTKSQSLEIENDLIQKIKPPLNVQNNKEFDNRKDYTRMKENALSFIQSELLKHFMLGTEYFKYYKAFENFIKTVGISNLVNGYFISDNDVYGNEFDDFKDLMLSRRSGSCKFSKIVISVFEIKRKRHKGYVFRLKTETL